MGVIAGGNVIGGGYRTPYTNAGAPVGGTSGVRSLATAGTPSGGDFRLSFDGGISGTIGYNAGTAAIQAALDLVPQIGSANTLVGGSALNNAAGSATTVTFQNGLAKQTNPAFVLYENHLTGGTAPSITIGTVTTAQTATARDALTGEMLIDTTNGKAYINSGTVSQAPTWTVVGSQS